MKRIGGALARGALAMSGRRSPWGGGDGKDGEPGDEPGKGSASGDGGPSGGGRGEGPSEPAPPPERGPRNPWLPPSSGTPGERPRRSASIEDIFKSRDARKPGNGGGGGRPGGMPRMPVRPDGKSWLPLIVAGVVLVWLGVTSVHMVGPKEEGIVMTFGKYARTIGPGVSVTLPWPLQTVEVADVTSIQRYTIPEGEGEKLMLTSDQNLVDLSYLVRWNIKNLMDYRFRLSDPEDTVREVAEAAMRSAIAEVTLDGALSGAGRAQVEQAVRERMQRVLDFYRAGVVVQGVEVKKADPPAKVIGAFQQVTAAQQDAERDRSNARAWAQQLLARAQGDAAAFDKVYEQYKLAPEVTKRRMYYETMERVLSNNDKVIVETNGVTPYLPLPEVRRRTSPSPSPSATPGAPATSATSGGATP
ncbi:protease modulator HflK [Novosphingobium sp. 9U]|uniref:protease modulator HflK n=1 Tax=Novosphingobium sp. 9U TaxID=2653158 RepID=UPI0012F2F1F6|nr:protease modulator HflK [Novosphingobium sp. 9U]VWX53081.1 HflK protein [Novosphingobium sp. 9U]